MRDFLELKKIKKTGFWPAVLGGGISAAIVPILNTAVRKEMFLQLEGNAMEILMDANWQMMSMLNLLLIVASACLLYHTEYADNGMQKMCTLPIKESRMFIGKFLLLCLSCLIVAVIEGAGMAFSAACWFRGEGKFLWDVTANMGFAFMLLLPGVLFMLLISAVCKNMWISLGIGVICVFTATMLPAGNFVLSLFPFALPFQIFAGTTEAVVHNYIIAAAGECGLGILAAVLFFKIRRLFA